MNHAGKYTGRGFWIASILSVILFIGLYILHRSQNPKVPIDATDPPLVVWVPLLPLALGPVLGVLYYLIFKFHNRE